MSKLSIVALFLSLAPATPAELDAAGVIDVEVDVADLDSRSELPDTVALVLREKVAAETDVPEGAVFAPDRAIHVELRPGPVAAGGDVLIRVESRVDGRVIAESSREICVACSDTDVAERAFPLVWSLLASFPAPPKPKVEPQPVADAGDAAPADLPEQRDPNRPMLLAGAGVLTAGIAAVGTGIALIVVDEEVVSPKGADPLEVIQYREPGIAVAAVGGAAAIAGAVLLGLAFRGKSRRVAFAPAMSPSFAGIAAVGRF